MLHTSMEFDHLGKRSPEKDCWTMTDAEDVEKSVIINSPSQDSFHLDD